MTANPTMIKLAVQAATLVLTDERVHRNTIIVGIEVLDHNIIGDDGNYCSLSERGLL